MMFGLTGNQLTKGVALILSDTLKDNCSITSLDLSSLWIDVFIYDVFFFTWMR